MTFIQDVLLSDYSTMGLGGNARYLAEISNKSELIDALAFVEQKGLPVIMIGGGSNIIWKDEGFDGLVLINQIKGINLDQTENEAELVAGAGEEWDEVVEYAAKLNLSGIESLSLIPGSAGATPIQNVGAYGQEIADTLVSLEAYDTQARDFVTLSKKECEFGYRHSRFKSSDKNRFFITSVKLKLSKTHMSPPFYTSLSNYLESNNVTDYSPMSIRNAVIAIRQAKLPDPKLIHNCGSFFGNPIVDIEKLAELNDTYEHVPSWPSGDGQVKLAAAWLIEQAGYKDKRDMVTGMATWPKQPLVLINEFAHSTKDLLAFKQEIVGAVEAKFGITLEQEPELLP
jgi:UDP-N-acetylmuramate dehydrogenase